MELELEGWVWDTDLYTAQKCLSCPLRFWVFPSQAMAPLWLLPSMAIILLGWTKVTLEFGGW